MKSSVSPSSFGVSAIPPIQTCRRQVYHKNRICPAAAQMTRTAASCRMGMRTMPRRKFRVRQHMLPCAHAVERHEDKAQKIQDDKVENKDPQGPLEKPCEGGEKLLQGVSFPEGRTAACQQKAPPRAAVPILPAVQRIEKDKKIWTRPEEDLIHIQRNHQLRFTRHPSLGDCGSTHRRFCQSLMPCFFATSWSFMARTLVERPNSVMKPAASWWSY